MGVSFKPWRRAYRELAFLMEGRVQRMSLKIYLLGQFSLVAGDQPLELPSRRAQSLLAYLAMTAGMTHRRERLAGGDRQQRAQLSAPGAMAHP